MKWNWTAQTKDCIFLDFETQSFADIKIGGRRYAEHPTTRLACASFSDGEKLTLWSPSMILSPGALLDGTPYDVWNHPSLPEWVNTRIERGATLCAHNAAEFDMHIWKRFAPTATAAPWTDTLPLCRSTGLPGSLESVCRRLFNAGKDSAAPLVKLLCCPKNGALPVGTPAAWNALARYAVQDVALLTKLHSVVGPSQEPDVLTTHFAVNARGIPIDRGRAAALIEIQREIDERGEIQARQQTDGAVDSVVFRSPKKMQAWLHSKGFQIPSLDKRIMTTFFEEPESFTDEEKLPEEYQAVISILRLRQDSARVVSGKCIAAIEASDSSGRAYDQFIYHGSHTGRWSARQLQPHNFSKGLNVDTSIVPDPPCITDVDIMAAMNECTAADITSTMLRGIICAPEGRLLAIADFGAIEARGVAWMAGQSDSLDAFAAGADPYIPLAQELFPGVTITKEGKERFVAKSAILGCCYGISGIKFESYCAASGINLAALSLSGAEVVKTYRQRNQQIVRLWRALEDAAKAAIEGHDTVAGRCRFSMRGADLIVELPSGRKLYYRNARIEPRVPIYCKMFNLPPVEKPTIIYAHVHGYEGMLYGSKICENLCQAICRDLLAWALVAVEKVNLLPVMSVHDEIVCEVEEAEHLRELVSIMSRVPQWAARFPILVEGFACERYTKAPPRNAFKATGRNGEVK